MTRGQITERDAVRLGRATLGLGLRIAGFAAVIVVVLSALAVFIVVRGQHRAADVLLDQTVARADDVVDPPAGVWLVTRGPSGTAITPGLPGGLPDETSLRSVAATGTSTSGDYLRDGVEYRVLTVRRADGVIVQAALDLTSNHEERTRLAAALLLTGALGLVLAAAAGVALARRAVRPMAAALTVQRRFVSDASHELRTPLTLLSTRAQLLRRHLTDEELRREADAVVADARHLTAILDDLLLAADPSGEDAEPFDLAELVGEVVKAHHTASGIPITVHRPDRPVPVRGAPTAIRRAMIALLDNAIRHATTAVTVTLSLDQRTALVDVADDGPGIDPDVLPHLFDRFVTTRTPTDTKRRYGLGLALVSDIAARHSGDVEAATTPAGARLRLTLPLDRPN